MAIQHRRGIYDRFDPSRLVAGEWAIVLSGDTSASDGRAAYICFAAGTVKRIATYEDMAESIANANEELIEELTAQITAATTAANTAASNANTKATAANTAASSANTAASAANTAASNANSKATAANTAASSANSAASSATTAAGRANTAADAANAAATSATEAAESVSDAAYRAETAATSANTAAGSANAAAQRANTAADSANAATSEANAAIEAMGDISELAVPEMTASVRGGAKVGGSTQVVGGKLEVKLSESDTGTSVTTGSTSALRELQVHGRSVQDGTPTPDAPVPVQVVGGANAWHESALEVGIPRRSVGITWVKNADGTYTANGTATANSWAYSGTAETIIDMAIPLAPGIYTATTNAQRCSLRKVSGGEISTLSNVFSSFTFTAEEGDSFFICPQVPNGVEVTNETYYVQIVPGSVAVPYTPYGSIALDIKGRNLTPFFSIPMGDTTYWQNETTPYTSSELGRVGFQGDDGWAHYGFDNSGRTANAFVNMRCKYSWHNADSFMPNETYTIITEIKGLTGSGLAIRPVRPDQDTSIFVDSDMRNIGSDGTYSWTVQTKSDISQMEFVTNGLMRVSAGKACSFAIRLSIVKGSVVLPYAPYPTSPCLIDLQGNILASLPAGASVLTSGARDVLRVDSAGHTTADMETGIVVFDGSDDEDWSIATIFGNQPYTTALNNAVLKPPSNGRAVPMLCNRLTATAPSAITTGTIGMALTVTGSLVVRMGSGDADLAAFKADLAANPLVIIYPLATPQTIDLGYIDPPAIPSGSVVTISASLTPTFDLDCWTEHASELADITDAITTLAGMVIGDEQESIASSIAPVEGSTASANHAVDDYLMLGARLYRVTTAIASGERIIPGTNVTETTVMAEIVSLLS